MKKNNISLSCLQCLVLCLALASCATHGKVNHHKESTALSEDGSSIAYSARGDGEISVVFVHGWLGDHTLWESQADYFSDEYRVVSLDLAGHGDSTANRKEFTMTSFAQDVAAVVDAAGGEKVVLVGHSMGGPIVVEAAKLLGDRVVGIVGVDAFYTPLAAVPEEKKLAFWEMLKSDYPKALRATVDSMFTQSADKKLVNSMYEKMLSEDHAMGVSALYECIEWNAHKEPQELEKVSGTLRNINGGQAQPDAVSNENVVVIPDAGHFVFIVKSDEFNADLEAMLDDFKD